MKWTLRLHSLVFPASLLAVATLVAPTGCNDATDGQTEGSADAQQTSQAAPSEPVRRPAPPERSELNDELFFAITDDQEERAIELVEQGASVHARNHQEIPAIFLSSAGCLECEGTMPRLTRVLLEYGADPRASISGGIQPVHWVARVGAAGRAGTQETLDLLLLYGADINARTNNGERPIDYAIRLGNEDWLQFLLSRGAKLN